MVVENMGVEEGHSYFVGREGVLVHNFSGPCKIEFTHIGLSKYVSEWDPDITNNLPDGFDFSDLADDIENGNSAILNLLKWRSAVDNLDVIANLSAWHYIKQAPFEVRFNDRVVKAVGDLHRAGLASSEMKKIGDIGLELSRRYGDDRFSVLICQKISKTAENAKVKGYDSFGVDINVASIFHSVLLSPGFKNSKISIEHLASQLRSTSGNNPGFIEQLNEGLKRITSSPNPSIYIESKIVQGDVVDEVLGEALQIKVLIGDRSNKVTIQGYPPVPYNFCRRV